MKKTQFIIVATIALKLLIILLYTLLRKLGLPASPVQTILSDATKLPLLNDNSAWLSPLDCHPTVSDIVVGFSGNLIQ